MFSLILSVLWSMSSNEEKSYVGTWPNANPNGGTMIEKKNNKCSWRVTQIFGRSLYFAKEDVLPQELCHINSVGA